MIVSDVLGAHHVVIDSKSYISNGNPDGMKYSVCLLFETTLVSSQVISRRRLKCLMKFTRRCCKGAQGLWLDPRDLSSLAMATGPQGAEAGVPNQLALTLASYTSTQSLAND